jgi:hypothetical protein
MASPRHAVDALEADTYAVTARREVVAARPPRRESPRFHSRGSRPGERGGIHQRRNKRSGL